MPQPIDVNTELGRVTAAERIAQIADRTSLAAQARIADEAEAQRLRAESQVRNADQKSEDVDEELRRRTPYVGRRRRRNKEDDRQAQEGAKPAARDASSLPVIPEDPEHHGLDITI